MITVLQSHPVPLDNGWEEKGDIPFAYVDLAPTMQPSLLLEMP